MMISTATTMQEEGCEFEKHLRELGFSRDKLEGGLVIWSPEISSSIEQLMMKERIKLLLKEMSEVTTKLWWQPSLIQFWSIEQTEQHVYLTTFDKPFAVGHQDFYAFRYRCMGQRYRVDEEANEEELGAVGRVYRNKCLEYSPDLRFYSNNEFPFHDDAYACGLKTYCAFPLFEGVDNFYCIVEILHKNFDVYNTFPVMQSSIEKVQLRTTHHSLEGPAKDVDSEILEMLQLAIRVMPQMQRAHVWIPRLGCPDKKINLSCMEIAKVIVADRKSWDHSYNYMSSYNDVYAFHHLGIGECTTTSTNTMMLFGNKPRICRNVCDYRISENPFAHYAQKERLSFCFAVRLQSLHDSRNDFVMVEFFLQFNNREDEFSKFCLPLILGLMKMKLKKYELAYKGELRDELDVEVVGESKKANLHCIEPSEEQNKRGWVFWSHTREEILQERIKCLMIKIADCAVVQFWSPNLDGEKCYLEASGQPFRLDHPSHEDLIYFMKQCMGHRYYVSGNVATELGPPGRVFLNGHPEITPNLCLYSSTEFPLRDHAALVGLKSYVALPIFKLNESQCLGVLELMSFGNSTLKIIGEELEAANLSSTHINFEPARSLSLSGNNDECWELASTELWQACELFAEIPQLYAAEVWTPYKECPSKNNTNFCMERVRTTEIGAELDPPLYHVQHVEVGKGIVGMAFASESKSCFCRNSCEFSIADQSLAHCAPRVWLDVCFAICLQSHHTDDLVYVLQFYLKGTCRKYEYFRTILCSLLQTMEQTLKSFRVSSGQELGEELVVEAIEFSQVNELDFCGLDQSDGLQVTFKFVNYRAQGHSEDKQVESVRVVAYEEIGQCSATTTILKIKDSEKEIEGRKVERKKAAKNIERSKGKKREAAAEETKPTRRITIEMLKPLFGRKLEDAGKLLGVHKSTIKRVCRENGVKEWPWMENHKNNISSFMKDQNSCKLPPQSARGPIVEPKVNMVVIKAKYKDDVIRVELCLSAGLEKLLNEVGRRLNLKVGSFKLKYLDEDKDEILLACDDDLQHCLKSPFAMDKAYIQVFVKLI